MCYAIPGKVRSVAGNVATIDYFGEKRFARTDGFRLRKGDYVYVQAGFVVDKAGKEEAEEALKAWREFEGVKARETRAPPTSALRLFFLYAHPCGDVLVAKGKLPASKLASMRRTLAKGGTPDEPPSLFEKAVERLGFTAARTGGARMDEDTIRKFFWFDHDDMVEDESLCRILPAKVLKVDGMNALVSTPAGRRNVNVSMLGKAAAGDLLAIHYNYACEKISRKDFGRLWKVKR